MLGEEPLTSTIIKLFDKIIYINLAQYNTFKNDFLIDLKFIKWNYFMYDYLDNKSEQKNLYFPIEKHYQRSRN